MVYDITPKAFQAYLLGVKSKNTAKKYAANVAMFLRLMKQNGYETFEELPPGLLSEFSSFLTAQQKQSASTVRVAVFAVKKYLEWISSKGIAVAAQSKPDLPKVQVTLREVLPAEMFRDYFRQADMDLHEPTRTAVMLLPCCGLRASEMVNLKLAGIGTTTIAMKNGKKKKTLFLLVRDGKGGKDRHVPLMEEGVEILTGYLHGWRNQPENRSGPWLFPRVSKRKEKSGKEPISDRYLRRALESMRTPLGVNFTPHTMRRTYITMLYRKGLDLRMLADIAGHKNIQTTINHYIVMDPDASVRALHDVGSSMTE